MGVLPMSSDFTDPWGNDLSATLPSQVAAIRGFAQGLLSYEQTLLDVLIQADADTEMPNTLLQAYAAVLWLLAESPAGRGHAQAYLKRAHLGLPRALPREGLVLAFVDAWVAGDIATTRQHSDELLDAFPRDLAAAKLRQYIDFNLGRFADLLRVGLAAQAAAPEVPYVHSMAAFGYEQCHLLAEAETAARYALDLLPKEPWAQHALAHVMLTEGRIDEGAEFLDSVSPQWDGLNSFMYTHLWWHQALFRLSQGHGREALELYDRHVWGVDKTYSQDQVGAVSLLARLELAGEQVAERWQQVADYLVTRAGDAVEPFLSLQYLYGLARAGRPEAQALLSAIKARSDAATEAEASAWRDCALPLARGIVALVGGEALRALGFFRQGRPYLSRIGGSHAQRDLFELFLLQALLDAGHDAEAQQVLEQLRLSDPYNVPLNRQLALVYDRLGLPRIAETARQRVSQRLAGKDIAL